MTKRICPKCGATWPKGNFCPKDGQQLQDVKAPPDAPSAAKPQAASAPAPDMAETRLDAPAIRAKQPAGRKAAAPEAKTVLDSPAVPLTRPPSKRRGKAQMVAPPKRQLAAGPKDDGAGQTAGGKPGTATSDRPASKSRGRADDKGFSETQWFMKGLEVDADLLEMVEKEEYDRDENISEEDRKGFTLRREDD